MSEWLNKLSQKKKKLILDDPTRTFNMDESGFVLLPREGEVLTEKGARTVYQIVRSNDKKQMTVIATVSASGWMVPPIVLFDWKNTPKREIIDNMPQGWGVGRSEDSWMTAEIFWVLWKTFFSNGWWKIILLFLFYCSSMDTLHILIYN